MATHTLDTLGLKCPQPILKIAAMSKEIQPGDMPVQMKVTGSSKHKYNFDLIHFRL